MHTVDRVIRLGIVALIVLLYFTGQLSGLAAVLLGIVAVVFAVTGAVGTCPLYSALGLSTRGKSAA